MSGFWGPPPCCRRPSTATATAAPRPPRRFDTVNRKADREAKRLITTAKQHFKTGATPLHEAVRFPVVRDALLQQRCVQLAGGTTLRCGCNGCGDFLPGVSVGVHLCSRLQLLVAAMQQQGVLATRREVRLQALRRLLQRAQAHQAAMEHPPQAPAEQLAQARAAAEAAQERLRAAEQQLETTADGVLVCRLCNQQVRLPEEGQREQHVHKCGCYYCRNLVVDSSDLPQFGMDLAEGKQRAEQLLQVEVPILAVMRAVSGGRGSEAVDSQGRLVCSLTYTAPAGSMRWGLCAVAEMRPRTWVAPYSGRIIGYEEAMAAEGEMGC